MRPTFYSCASAIVLTDKNDLDPVIIFINRNYKQISQKAAKYGVDIEDATQSVCVIYLQQISKYDSALGTLERYIFGYFEKFLKRQKVNPLHFAVSLDDAKVENDIAGYSTQQESIDEDEDLEILLSTSTAPGSEGLLEVADLVSGKSSLQLAEEYCLSRRQINNKLSDFREASKKQFSLPFKRRKK